MNCVCVENYCTLGHKTLRHDVFQAKTWGNTTNCNWMAVQKLIKPGATSQTRKQHHYTITPKSDSLYRPHPYKVEDPVKASSPWFAVSSLGYIEIGILDTLQLTPFPAMSVAVSFPQHREMFAAFSGKNLGGFHSKQHKQQGKCWEM